MRERVRHRRHGLRQRTRPAKDLAARSSGKLSRAKARNLCLSGEIQPYDIAA
jgi:hypothetical protein